MRIPSAFFVLFAGLFLAASTLGSDSPPVGLQPGSRVLLDAHQLLSLLRWWFDRIDRALSRERRLRLSRTCFGRRMQRRER